MPPKPRTSSKSPSRAKRASRSRSRGRSKPRTTSKSPSRTKSKAKQSPSPARKPRQVKTPKQSPSRAAREPTPTRRSARLEAKENETPKPVAGRSSSSDKKQVSGGKSKHSYEFGGPIGTFILFLLFPVLTFVLIDYCSKKSCDIKKFPTISLDVNDYFTKNGAIYFFGFHVIQLILSALPVGRVVKGAPSKSNGRRFAYRLNGRFSLLATLVAIAAGVYFKAPFTSVYKSFRSYAATGSVFSIVVGIFLYIRAGRRSAGEKTPANTGCVTYDFVMGREFNPRLGSLDIKMHLFRSFMLTFISWNAVFIAMACKIGGSPQVPLAMVAAFQCIPSIVILLHEEELLRSFMVNGEGLGWMTVFALTVFVPVVNFMHNRYLLFFPQEFVTWQLVLIGLLYVLGFVVWFGSNRQKYLFKVNPGHPSLSHLDSIPGPSGQQLLASGWWGMCRHPNYLGDIIMIAAASLLCGFASVVPHLAGLLNFAALVDRQHRDDMKCSQRYKAAWGRYRERVKYRLFPKIY